MPEADVDQHEVLYIVFKTPLQKMRMGREKNTKKIIYFLHPSTTKYCVQCVKRLSLPQCIVFYNTL